MTSKSELKRHVALGKPGALAEKLWYQHSHSGQMYKSDFLAAINEACAAVRARDAEVCRDKETHDITSTVRHITPADCAAAIAKEPLP